MQQTDIDLIAIIKVLLNLATEYNGLPLTARGTLTLLTSAGMLALSEPVQASLRKLVEDMEKNEDFKLFRESLKKQGN